MAAMSLKKLAFLGLILPLMTTACGDDEVVGDEEGTGSETDGGDGDGDPATASDTDTDTDPSGDGDGDDPTTGDGDGDDPTTGDGDGDPEPPEPLDPLPEFPAGEWNYIELEGMFCRDGSPAGFGIRYADNPTDQLGIFFEGGGACFNGFTCLANPSSADPGAFDPGPFGGVFDDQNPDNPLMDFNWIYFPYCTGDAFFGTNPDSDVPGGPSGQMFVGHTNTLIALDRIADTWPEATDVVATGVSGGGFGAAANYHAISTFFPDNDVVLIDDSGPIFRDQYLAPCLQQQWRDIWGITGALPDDCPECTGQDGGGLANFYDYVTDLYPNAPKGLISSHADNVISLFFGYGNNNCNVLFPSFPNFEEALYDLRDTKMATPDTAVYYKTGQTHTYLQGGDYYNLSVNGTLLSDWVTDLINGDIYDVVP